MNDYIHRTVFDDTFVTTITSINNTCVSIYFLQNSLLMEDCIHHFAKAERNIRTKYTNR